MVEASHLSKTFRTNRGPVVALHEVSFVAKPGEVTALLGINGAGKTTCLRILSTVIKSDSGSAKIGGYDVVAQSADVRRSIGFLSASTALYGKLNGRQVLHYFGQLYSMPADRIKQRVAEVTEILKLGSFIDQTCDKLSTGQKQRISIARAILHEPPILFFDEPTSGLDVVSAQTIMEFIEHCRDQGQTVVFSTHIMSEVERLCDHVAIIHEGRIFEEGTVPQILEKHSATTLERAFLNIVGYQRGSVA